MILEKLPLFFRSDSSITECLRDDLVRELVKSKRVDFFFLLIDFNQQSGGRQCAAAKKWFKNPISQLECTYFNSTVWQKLWNIMSIQNLKLSDTLKYLFKFFFCPNFKKFVQSENHVMWENIKRTLNFRNRTKNYIWPELKWLDSRTSSLRYELAKNLFVTTTFEIIGID